MKSLITLLTFAIASISYGQAQVRVFEKYLSGKDLYDSVMKSPDGQQYPLKIKGEFVQVPLDYKKPSAGTMDVYYRVAPNFDPQKPTVLFFYGGPGGNSWYATQYNQAKDVNFVYMDQRGTGFSKPTLEQIQNTDFFTSEYVANDALAVLKKLKIKKVTAYGHSYGTVPATIFASQFPQVTRSLILEGVVFDGNEELWSNSHRRKLLNSFYRDLSDEQKEKIQKFTQREDVPDTWLGAIAQSTMYSKNYHANLIEELNKFIDQFDTKEADKSILDRESYLLTESMYFGGYFFNHIACKELSRMNPHSNFGSILTKEGKFVPSTSTDGSVCLTLKNFTTGKIRIYSAKNYPVRVPTTYFQGTTDGATAIPNAIHHYEQSAKGNAQLIVVTNEGHGPMAMCLARREEMPCESAYTNLFMTAVRGEAIHQNQLNAATTPESKWVAMQKWK